MELLNELSLIFWMYLGNDVETSWEDLEALRQSISDRCGWDSSLEGSKE